MCQELAWMYRDQRTVKVPHTSSGSSSSSTAHRYSNTFVKELLAVSVCLVLFVPVGVMSAPASREDQPMWKNPCGLPAETKHHGPPRREEEILQDIILATQRALDEAMDLRERYVFDTFGLPYSDHHSSWATAKYDWLPSRTEVPKTIGETVPEKHLMSLEMDKLLINSFRYLQTMTAALHQVQKDMEEANNKYTPNFKKIINSIYQVMCEVRSAISQRHLSKQVKDVSEDFMDDKVKSVGDFTQRNIRDWVIFREYMNLLEYVAYTFEHLLNKKGGS